MNRFVVHSTIKMSKVLKNKTNFPGEIPENNSGKNDFLKNVLQSGENRVSIELSPNSEFNSELLVNLAPQFISVAWLGTTYLELPTEEIPAVVLAQKLCDKGFPVLVHLAGRNLNKLRMLEILNQLKHGGVKNILALQGDWSDVVEKDDRQCDFPYAANLVLFIKENFKDQFCVGVAGYPDTHSHSQNKDDDVKFLQQKVSAGADFIITQAAFEYEVFEKFAKNCRENKINVPVLPGIFIIQSYKSLINMVKWCQFEVPKQILDFVEKNQANEDVIKNYGLNLAADLIKQILTSKEKFAGVQIFSMNDVNLVLQLVSRLKGADV